MDFDAIIIGGGLGGLSAGAMLSRHGKKVLLLEQHYVPGGCATTFKRKEFLMEAGLHAMDGHLIVEQKSNSILRFLGVSKHVEFLPLPEFFHIRNDHLDFNFPNDFSRAKAALEKAYPEEAGGIRKFFKMLSGVQEEFSHFPKKIWEKILKFPLFPFFFPHITRTFYRTLGHYLDRNFRNEELKVVLQGNLLYYHDDPHSMSLVFFAKAQASFLEHGSFFIKGGSQNLSDSLHHIITENGGIVLLGKKVEKVLIENRKANGVKFRDAFNPQLEPELFRAKHIIHGGAVPLLPALLDGKYAEKIKKCIRGKVPATSLFCIYLGFSKKPESLGNRYYSSFIFGNDVKQLKDVHNNYTGSWENRSFAFVDYGQINSGLAPEGKSFGALCTADNLGAWEGLDEAAYQKKKAEIADILLKRLERAIPGITDIIEYYEIGTPRTIKSYTLNPAAAPYGFAQLPNQVGFKRPSYSSPVKNLWLAGTWTFPGGGFTGALVSGFLCGLQVRKKMEKDSPSELSPVYSDSRLVELIRNSRITSSTIELTFRKPENFSYKAGQYAYLSLPKLAADNNDINVRPLSMASHPSEKHIKFVMRNSDSGYKKSCALLEPGNRATIYGPVGNFTLNPKSPGIVFLISGIGISPVLAMLRELEFQKYNNPVYLFYSNKDEKTAAYHSQLQKYRLNNFSYIPVFTASRERLNIIDLKDKVTNLKANDFYIVGGSSFLGSMENMLLLNGVDSRQIHTDDFG